MKYSTVTLAIASFLPITSVLAHGDESHSAIHKRNEFISRRSLAACRDNENAKALFKRSFDRRSALVNQIRKERGLLGRSLEESHRIAKRAFEDVSKIDHNSTFADARFDTDSSVLFSGNTSCLLMPEVTEGPYFVSGEYVRTDITDGQVGVPLYLDIQVIDTNTCEPVSSAYFDAWHTNATGVYSGVVANGNGVGEKDPTNLDNTFCRGVQFTDSDGVIKFKTIFPGHYSGRTTHIHIMSHKGGTVHANGTYSGHGRVTHVGQLFFDEDLKSTVKDLAPYNTNTQSVISNERDRIAHQQAENDYDPFVKYAYLGDSVADGILAWITVGIDQNAESDPYVATELTENGGVVVGHRGVVGTGEEVDEVPSGEPEEPSGPTETSSAQTGSPTTGASTRGTTTLPADSTTSPATTPGDGSQIAPSMAFVALLFIGSALWIL
ncbi:hypothetical protein AOL_s00081g35 [Orbilia oligospora ATCC 24927]|uniref:Intradiol ring-cleavage dioxygenases domain-containing protein n=1 Tax=Arthrobotrys oligospora (strain ATCC 24927 / CBS 115.81 / DSM 1491) TaxID=756982 RepID=G1XF94_ARTOA|nr:hypothetical protein AOL_s00081g35 [Orbilia oligospora ATCC 24927]EGX48172.1 hypothetical protein AOL_s00081g35 [Orbilia oligospora ATCC 24927]